MRLTTEELEDIEAGYLTPDLQDVIAMATELLEWRHRHGVEPANDNGG